MGLFDFIDDYRAEFWAFLIVFFIFGISAALKNAGAIGFLVAGGFGGIVSAYLIHIGKHLVRR